VTNEEIKDFVRCYLRLPFVIRLRLANDLGVAVSPPEDTGGVEWTRLLLVEAKAQGKLLLLREITNLETAERQKR
jgi:hypothetical protein